MQYIYLNNNFFIFVISQSHLEIFNQMFSLIVASFDLFSSYSLIRLLILNYAYRKTYLMMETFLIED